MKIYLNILLFVFTLAACNNESKTSEVNTPPADSTIFATTINRLDGSSIHADSLTKKIAELAKAAKVTGAVVSIFNNNELVYQKAVGYKNFNKKDTLTTSTGFYSASLSKTAFAYIVMQLVEDGVLHLDTPLQHYLKQPLPDIKFEKEWRGFTDLKGDDRYKLITARMCLSHTTGFPNWRFLTEKGFDEDGKLFIQFTPGAKYSYSGEGLQLLQFVIEQITNRGLEEIAREKLFGPLGMNMTSYVWQQRFENKYCNGHTTTQEILGKDKEDDAAGAGSMETTAEDYSKFLVAFMKHQLINDSTFNEITKQQVRIKSKQQFGPNRKVDTDEYDKINLGYGLGVGYLESPYGKGIFKEGHGDGFQHYFIFFPDKKTGVLILTNSDNGESIFKELLEITIADTITPWQWENYIPYNN
jgi:D-alanyl-D-alanine-carboxypeptidase/D-alanyl-D-alanine-endopeptidase